VAANDYHFVTTWRIAATPPFPTFPHNVRRRR
jgi:hypothetical protein